MAGNNPHGRLGQPSWDHLQVPPFMQRPPQLAHLPNERGAGVMGVPLGWPPMHSAETLYGYMAAAAAASAASNANNHKTVSDFRPELLLTFLTFVTFFYPKIDMLIFHCFCSLNSTSIRCCRHSRVKRPAICPSARSIFRQRIATV